jgi:hypothetical protein
MANRKRVEFVGLYLSDEEKAKLQAIADDHFDANISAALRWVIWHLTDVNVGERVREWRKIQRRNELEEELRRLTGEDW